MAFAINAAEDRSFVFSYTLNLVSDPSTVSSTTVRGSTQMSRASFSGFVLGAMCTGGVA